MLLAGQGALIIATLVARQHTSIPILEAIAKVLVLPVSGQTQALLEPATPVGAEHLSQEVLLITPVQHAYQECIMIASHVVLLLSFIPTLEGIVVILVQTVSGETQALDFVYLAIAVELALSPAKPATEEPTALALVAMQEHSFIAGSV